MGFWQTVVLVGHRDGGGGAVHMDILIYGLEEYDHGLYHIIYIMEWQTNLI